MKRLKGPELKMPDLKAPRFLADVYYDLRDRRLLPVVALVLVATAAVPFLLGDSEEAPPPMAVEEAAEAARLEIEDEPGLTVVEAKPGLRDYRKRLRKRTPTDPFKQRYTGLPNDIQLESSEVGTVSETDVSSSSGETSVTEVDGSVTEVETVPPSGPSSGAGGGGSGAKGAGSDDLRLFGFRPDVRFGVAGSQDLELHEDLPLGSLLPKKKPLLVFIGVSENGERTAFDVSPEVTLVRGNGACIGGMQSCRLLFLREGEAVDLLTEEAGRTFRLKVESIDFVEVDVPKQASASGTGAGPRQPRSLGLVQ
ncbi:MAG TPA: hypothetical protein VF729_11170, partial [Solirubrobacterales bacterium]